MDIKELEQIVQILKQNDVVEFELENNGTVIKLVRGSRNGYHNTGTTVHALPDVEPAILTTTSNANGTAHQPPVAAIEDNFLKVESPIVGTFYRKPSPDSESFVKVGDTVKKGAKLCIIEAMKLMNEIESPYAGKIEKILLDDGQVVEFGEALFLINPNI